MKDLRDIKKTATFSNVQKNNFCWDLSAARRAVLSDHIRNVKVPQDLSSMVMCHSDFLPPIYHPPYVFSIMGLFS